VTLVPDSYRDTVEEMKNGHMRILEALQDMGIVADKYPQWEGQGRREGRAAAKAFPMQGVLKYHGMADWYWRAAFLPSASVNNNAAYSLTYVEYDPYLPKDSVELSLRHTCYAAVVRHRRHRS
jgi:hypothetical protein